MKTITKEFWNYEYEFPIHKMVASVVFPPEWNEQQRSEMLEREYSKTHRIEQSERDADRYNLMAIPIDTSKIIDDMNMAAIINHYNILNNVNTHF